MIEIETVYEEYFHDVYRYLLKLTSDQLLAEEITAETFMKVIKYQKSYRGESHIKTWIIQIARNTYLNYKRKYDKIELHESVEMISKSNNFEQVLFKKFDALTIHKILHKLQEPYKEVFSLRIFGELTFREIGEIFGKTENWACVTYYRSKEKIKKEVQIYDKN